MFLFWGEELFCFYNDAYRPSLGNEGKHPNALGKPAFDIWPEIWGIIKPLLNQVMSGGEATWSEDQLVPIYRNGQLEDVYWTFSYSPVFDETGKPAGVLTTCMDTTGKVYNLKRLKESETRYRTLAAELEQQVQERTEELETINEELTVTNEELASANAELIETNDRFNRSNQSLEQFAYVASHDLQEPLRKIQSFGDLLKKQYEEELGEGVEYLQRMQSGAARMSVLIKDLLTFSRISNRQEAMDVVSLADTVETVLNDLELPINETNATIHVGVLPSVQGDATQLGQLFQNLLSNALKFRRDNVAPVIRINYQLMMASDLPADIKPARWSLAYHRIDVSDNGIGFDPKYADRIFQVFQRLHGKMQYSGTGIGLAICEKVAINHGGTITVVSQPEQGSTFSVYLPV